MTNTFLSVGVRIHSPQTIVLLTNVGDSGNLGNLFRNLWDDVLNAVFGDV